VLQLKLTNKPFFILTSLRLTILPLMSVIFTSPSGIDDPSDSSPAVTNENRIPIIDKFDIKRFMFSSNEL
jgi:hypothetical protein